MTRAPSLTSQYQQGDQGSLLQAVLIAGAGLDQAETATSQRDVALCLAQLTRHHQGRLQVEVLPPDRKESTTERALEVLRTRDCDALVVTMTGHGGGKNFGGVGALNLTRDAVAEALTRARFSEATVVVDCCWSGEFTRSFKDESTLET